MGKGKGKYSHHKPGDRVVLTNAILGYEEGHNFKVVCNRKYKGKKIKVQDVPTQRVVMIKTKYLVDINICGSSYKGRY